MTITEFLLARIAEDEAVSRALDSSTDPLNWTQPGDPAVGLAGPVDGPSGYESIVIDPARVLAESAAKRLMVGRLACPEPACGDHDCEIVREDWRILASVYARHPDFDDAWRV